MKKYSIIVTCLLIFSIVIIICMYVTQYYPSKISLYVDAAWDDPQMAYRGDAIPTAECAKAVATAIFDHMTKSEHASTFVPQEAFLKEPYDVWVVVFCEEDTGMLTLGGGYSIALRKEDGRVVGIWLNE